MNRTATRVEARWNVRQSPSLTEEQRTRLLRKLANRIDSRGVLRVVADERRSQLRNREAALARLTALVAQALTRPKPRKKTKRPRAAEERRLADKQRRSDTKRDRRPPKADD